MTAITFDTLEFSKTLQNAGIAQEHADAMATAQRKAMQEMVSAQELVTKKDLKIALAETKHELLQWVMGIALAQTALIIAVIAFMKQRKMNAYYLTIAIGVVVVALAVYVADRKGLINGQTVFLMLHKPSWFTSWGLFAYKGRHFDTCLKSGQVKRTRYA